MYDYLIVGSGLYGAIFAHEAKIHGKKVLVVDKRPNIAGNIYTENVEGINVHKYGAHIFHTNNKKVWNYITQFAEFNRFTNSPVGNYKGELYSLPFNMYTFNKMWGVVTPEEAATKIEEQRKEITHEPQNLEEQAISLVGRDIYEKLIKGYTEKQWGRDCKKLNFNMSAWTSMYSMQLIKDNKWKFASERDIISEDVFSLLELYRYVDSIAVMPKAYYYYCNNEVSLTRVFREDRFSLIGKFYIESVSLIEKNKYPVSVKRAMAYPYLANIIGAMKLLNESNLLTEEKRYQMKLLLNDAVFKLALSDIDLRYESFSRRILIFMMKLKLASGCLFLLAMKK